MNNNSEKRWYGMFRSLTAVTAAAAVAVTFIRWPEPVSVIYGLLATGAMLAVICIANSISGGRFRWNAIFLAVALIFANLSPAAFFPAPYYSAILALSLLFSLLFLESDRADHAADAAALMTAAAFICPPLIWLLIPQTIVSVTRSRRPARILAGETVGITITSIAACCIIILTAGGEGVPRYAGLFLEKISVTEVVELSFKGWLSLSRCAFIFTLAATVVLFIGCRTRLGIYESVKMEYSILFALSTIPVAILYGGTVAQSVELLFMALSAFIIMDMMQISEHGRIIAIPLSACFIFILAEILSGFIPEMNKVFAML